MSVVARGKVHVRYHGGTKAVVDGFLYTVPARCSLRVTPTSVTANGEELPRSDVRAEPGMKLDGKGCSSASAFDGANVGDNFNVRAVAGTGAVAGTSILQLLLGDKTVMGVLGDDGDDVSATVAAALAAAEAEPTTRDAASSTEDRPHSGRCRCFKHRAQTPEQRAKLMRFVHGEEDEEEEEEEDTTH